MRDKKPRGRFAREKPARQPKPKVLIVTEGEKTEIFYFRACARACGVAAFVTVTHHPDGPTPDKVFEQAVALADREVRRGSPYASAN